MSNHKTVQFVQTTPEDLANLISDKVKSALSQIQGTQEPEQKPKFITREQARKMLNVTYPTLHRYHKNGKLVGYKFGHKVYYKLEDIENGFIKDE
ncbi:helix-turn-helix domain-containing protein [Aestuariivivens sediminicola]|uniref:helix-turn-helix domain-containing protein n=1 Tax=Aestuariivivens sediminicola TaxID=2913560 RepID=UPI001F5777DF|nr:helix-turn-helix domain-containing protein [Aestuariivivens sediminicola]